MKLWSSDALTPFCAGTTRVVSAWMETAGRSARAESVCAEDSRERLRGESEDDAFGAARSSRCLEIEETAWTPSDPQTRSGSET
jgi:hypothetical protein